MRKILFAVSASLLCICISCNNSSTTLDNPNNNSQAQKNLDAWHVVRMAFANGNPDAVDSVIADDYIDHKSNDDVIGRDSVKANIVRWQANYKNMKMEVIKELADKDYAFFWMRYRQ